MRMREFWFWRAPDNGCWVNCAEMVANQTFWVMKRFSANSFWIQQALLLQTELAWVTPSWMNLINFQGNTTIWLTKPELVCFTKCKMNIVKHKTTRHHYTSAITFWVKYIVNSLMGQLNVDERSNIFFFIKKDCNFSYHASSEWRENRKKVLDNLSYNFLKKPMRPDDVQYFESSCQRSNS